MKIPKIINNHYVKLYGLFALLSAPIVLTSRSCDDKIIDDAKKEIQAKDSLRYFNVNQNSRDIAYWRNEVKKMNDSIRMDSVARKAYFEGAQMVRDSIANSKKECEK